MEDYLFPYTKEEMTTAYNAGWWTGFFMGIPVATVITVALGALWLFSD